jgi:hypothetical protein
MHVTFRGASIFAFVDADVGEDHALHMHAGQGKQLLETARQKVKTAQHDCISETICLCKNSYHDLLAITAPAEAKRACKKANQPR